LQFVRARAVEFSVLALIASTVLVASQPVSAAVPATPTQAQYLILNSQPGDYIGGGLQRTITSDEWSFYPSTPAAGFLSVSVFPRVGPGFWYLTFAAPQGQALVAGTYTGAARAGFGSAGAPGLDVNGEGRGCNTLTGQFAIDVIQFSSSGSLRQLHATFEQHCEGAAAALLGEIKLSSPPRLDFGTQRVGTAGAPQIATINNATSTPFSITSLTISGTNGPDFTILGESCLLTPIAAGSSCGVAVLFSASAVGQRTARLAIDTAPAGRAESVELAGVGETPSLQINMSSNFGPLNIGTRQVRVAEFQNFGNVPVTMKRVTLLASDGSGFTLVSEDCSNRTLLRYEFCSAIIAFQPTRVGTYTATLTARDDAAGAPHSLQLQGAGARAVVTASASLTFAAVKVGHAGLLQNWVLTNTGPVDLVVNDISMDGKNSSDFVVVTETCTGSPIGQGSSCVVAVAAAPTEVGPLTATLVVRDQGAASPRRVALAGNGTP
jgi:hypothetical protein